MSNARKSSCDAIHFNELSDAGITRSIWRHSFFRLQSWGIIRTVEILTSGRSKRLDLDKKQLQSREARLTFAHQTLHQCVLWDDTLWDQFWLHGHLPELLFWPLCTKIHQILYTSVEIWEFCWLIYSDQSLKTQFCHIAVAAHRKIFTGDFLSLPEVWCVECVRYCEVWPVRLLGTAVCEVQIISIETWLAALLQLRKGVIEHLKSWLLELHHVMHPYVRGDHTLKVSREL